MRRADSVHVETLDEFQVVHHNFLRLHMSQRIAMLVAVYTFFIYGHSVHVQLRVLGFYFAESHLCGRDR